MAKRGRPSGVTSWWRNPNNIAAHHAQALMELWLAGAPVVEIRVMLSSLAGRPEYQALIDECWSIIENERRFTVPPKIKRKFCRLAVAHVMELHRDAVQRRQARAAERRLAIQGFSHAATAEILRRTTVMPVSIEALNLERVLMRGGSCPSDHAGPPQRLPPRRGSRSSVPSSRGARTWPA
jgi:hypothetical protein